MTARRLRIVLFAETLDVGGAERVVVDLANALAERHAVTVVCAQRTGALASQLASAVFVHCLHQLPGNDPRTPFRLARILRSFRADVIHTHHWGVFLEGVLAGKMAGTPTMVHTVHGLYMEYPDGPLSRTKIALRHWLERRSVAYCRQVVCVSADLVRHCRDEIGIPDRNLVTIVNGMDFGTREPRSIPETTREFVYATVGRLAPVKNQRLLIAAFAAAFRRQGNLRLLLAGDGPERKALERLAAVEGVAANVEFLGVVTDVDAVLGRADAFVLSSLSEGLPMAALEAMRARLPILATRVGGLPDVVEDGRTGLLVEAGDGSALTEGMLMLAAAPARAAAMGQAGYSRLREHFGRDAMVRAYEQLYDPGI